MVAALYARRVAGRWTVSQGIMTKNITNKENKRIRQTPEGISSLLPCILAVFFFFFLPLSVSCILNGDIKKRFFFTSMTPLSLSLSSLTHLLSLRLSSSPLLSPYYLSFLQSLPLHPFTVHPLILTSSDVRLFPGQKPANRASSPYFQTAKNSRSPNPGEEAGLANTFYRLILILSQSPDILLHA